LKGNIQASIEQPITSSLGRYEPEKDLDPGVLLSLSGANPKSETGVAALHTYDGSTISAQIAPHFEPLCITTPTKSE